MPVVRSSRLHALIGAIAKGATGLLVAGLIAALGRSGFGQAPATQPTKSATNTTLGQPIIPLGIPSLTTIHNAELAQDCTLVQLRRFRDEKANIVTVRERLEIDADGSADPRFLLTFIAVEGELPGSPAWLKWQQTYSRYARQLVTQGSFRVRNLTRAQQNYTLHDFGPTVRASRSARRLVVFPQSLDKAIWVIDVDSATGVPLYTAEFDAQMHLLTEVEALTFMPSVQPLPAAVGGPGSPVTHATFAAAVTSLASPPGLVDPDVQLVPEYHLERVETRIDPLNAQPKLVMTYSDGIDQFMVVQSPGTADFFAGLPGSTATTNTIGRYRDPAMSVLLFWEGGVSFQVAGRGALLRLDDLAKRVLLQALSSN